MSNNRLKSVKARDVIKAFTAAGFVVKQPGNHVIMDKPGHPDHLSIPNHGSDPIRLGTLMQNIRRSGLTKEQFIQYLDS